MKREMVLLEYMVKHSFLFLKIKKYISDVVGIDLDDEYIKGMAGKPKGKYIFNILKQYPNIKKVEFYDDSEKNTKDVQQALQIAKSNGMIVCGDVYLVKGQKVIKQKSSNLSCGVK